MMAQPTATPVWLPIETSPRSNQARLVHCPDKKNTFLVSWQTDEGSYYGAEGVWIHFGTGSVLREKPTHWMPLPPPPADGGGVCPFAALLDAVVALCDDHVYHGGEHYECMVQVHRRLAAVIAAQKESK